MVAFALVLAIFCYWSVIGFALVSRLRSRVNLLQNALLAPVTGLVATVLLVFWINLAGIPVRYGGPAVTLGLAAVAAWLFKRSSAIVPARRLLPFVAVLLLAALVTGYPILRFGFDWVSYGNDDMANYSLAAKLFLNHGHFELPDPNTVLENRDLGPLWWYYVVVGANRHGTDELLAWVASLTGLWPVQAYMSLMLSLHLVLISAAGSLILERRERRFAALLTCLALAFSALTTLGTLYQLIAQVAGLGALAGTCAVVLRRQGLRKSERLLAGLLTAGMLVLYPEIFPFLGASYVVYHSVLLFRKKEPFRRVFANVWQIAAFTSVFLNVIVINAAVTLLMQTDPLRGGKSALDSLFPYYLTPAGFAYLWGFHGIGQAEVGLVLDLGIVLGAVLFSIAAIVGIFSVWRGQAAAVVLVVMVMLTLHLFRVGSDFGLYKIAMYLQLFLVGTLCTFAVQLFTHTRKWIVRATIILACGIPLLWGARTSLHYANVSLGYPSATGLVEVPYFSSEGMVSELSRLPTKPNEPIISDTPNVVLAKFESLYHGPLYFMAKELFETKISRSLKRPVDNWNPYFWIYGDIPLQVNNQRASRLADQTFDMHGAVPFPNEFRIRRELQRDTEFRVIESAPRISVFNRRTDGHKGPLIRLVANKDRRNRLMFVASELGKTSYTSAADSAAGRVSMYPLESDYFFKGETWASIGRVSLFRISNSSPKVRMVIEYTASLNQDARSEIPRLSAVGEERSLFSVKGRGSARLFSAPLEPQQIEGGHYITLDMGSWGSSFPQIRSRIMSLWGTDAKSDRRRIVGFARDISLIADEEYWGLAPPRAIQWFPDDLKNNDLEYSGIYEDGWVAESSYLVLKADSPSTLIVSLLIPTLRGRPAASSAALLLDGVEVGRQSTASNSISFKVPVQAIGRHRIELQFDQSDNLPAPDNRPVSAQIRYIGFQTTHSGPPK